MIYILKSFTHHASRITHHVIKAKIMKIITLGTGAAVPTLQRGHPATALWWEGKYFLFDCGEATQIQFRRGGIKFSKLDSIFITHLHGDHILGIMGLLMSLELANREKPLFIYGPPGIKEYIEMSTRLMKTVFNFEINIMEIGERYSFRKKGYEIKIFPLEHRVFCLGYVFLEDNKPGKFNIEKARELGIPEGPLYGKLQKGEDILFNDKIIKSWEIMGERIPGKKIVYCGDTRPGDEIIEMAMEADLLIYEGTFSPEEIERAKVSGHSTTLEAAELAQKAMVKQLILNHISSRYQDMEEILGESKKIFPNVIIAKDLMEINL